MQLDTRLSEAQQQHCAGEWEPANPVAAAFAEPSSQAPLMLLMKPECSVLKLRNGRRAEMGLGIKSLECR